ncbi:laminin-binding protein Lsa27, partial [Leptospira interrogans]|uniref:laminin-binding protein Lsa27 n=1 Tax=Leptospira interrogans TaxID=173 RepID=UPI001E415B4B
GPKEEQFADGIKYLGGSNQKGEDQFKSIGLNARDIAKEQLMKEFLRFKEGIEEKNYHRVVSLSTPRVFQSIQRAYNIPSKYDAMDAWVKSFEKGKAWCDYDLLFKDKIVSYEIEPLQASEYNSFDGKSSKRMSYRVYLRKEGQTGKLTLENSHVLVEVVT